jgi:hypothetical protein
LINTSPQEINMTIATIPAPRLRLSRILPAAVVAVGLVVGTTAVVRAIDDGDAVSSPTPAPAVVSNPDYPFSINYEAPTAPAVVSNPDYPFSIGYEAPTAPAVVSNPDYPFSIGYEAPTDSSSAPTSADAAERWADHRS